MDRAGQQAGPVRRHLLALVACLAVAAVPALAELPAPASRVLAAVGTGARLATVPVDASPLGLPAMALPADNPPSRASVDLGRKLFFDRRLSFNRTLSCAMCHIPEQGFTQNEMRTPVGIEGRFVKRNAPSLYNVG